MNTSRISVICTVLNEGESIRRLLESLAAQTRQPDEVVIVDGGSRDTTVAVIDEYAGRLPLRVLIEPGANISRGRNVAIAAASGDIIASTDAGVWLEPQWLEKLIQPLEGYRLKVEGLGDSVDLQPSTFNLQRPQAAAGFFVPDVRTTFEIAMGATVLPTADEIKPESFLPSSRSVAFTQAAWKAAGGYPEWLDYCEDLIFDFRLRQVAGPFAWAPEAVAHFRPRGTLKSFFKQYYRYARGDGKADLWRKRHLIRYITYLVIFPVLLILGLIHNPLWFLALLVGVLAYCRTPLRRLLPRLAALAPFERIKAIALVPVIRAAGDVAKMLGYPAGWVWRIQNRRRPEIHWQQK